jgi:hypothetical protein
MAELYTQTENSKREPEENDLDEMMETMKDRDKIKHYFCRF